VRKRRGLNHRDTETQRRQEEKTNTEEDERGGEERTDKQREENGSPPLPTLFFVFSSCLLCVSVSLWFNPLLPFFRVVVEPENGRGYNPA
jgi:hypothetical protein